MQKQTIDAKQSTASVRRAVRLGRLFKTLRNLIAILIVLAILIMAFATLDNALAPAVQLAHAADGPAALSVVRAFEYDARANVLYAGSNAGVFISTDDGLNWFPASEGLPSMDIQSLLFDRRTGDLYAIVFGSGLYRLSSGSHTWVGAGGFNGSALLSLDINQRTGTIYAGLIDYGMYISPDDGYSWQTIGMALSNITPYDLLAGPQPGEVFVASNDGIYHSTEVTSTWNHLTSNITTTVLARDPRSGIIYAGTGQGVLTLTPSQDTYLVDLTGLTGPEIQCLLFDDHTGTLFACTPEGIYRSTDGAATWESVNQGLASLQVHTIYQKPYTQELFAGTDSGIFRSTDGGTSWHAVKTPPYARYGQALLVNQPDNTLYAGTLGGGVFRSTDGGANWQPINTGLRNTVVQALGIDHDTNLLFAGTRNGIYRSDANTINWTLASPVLAGQEIVQMAVDERHGNVYAVTSMGDVWRSSNAGTEWGVVEPLRAEFARTVAVSYYDSAVYVGAYHGGVLASNDAGYTWAQIPNRADARDVEALTVDERNGALFVGALDGTLYRVTDINTSAVWTELGDGLPGNIVAMAMDEKTGALLAAPANNLYQLWPDEMDWLRANRGMHHTSVMALGAHRSDDILYAGVMAGGVYRSIDNGSNWQQISNGLTDIDMRSVAVDDTSGKLLVNATGRGIFQYDPEQQSWSVLNIGLQTLSTTQSLATDAAGNIDLMTSEGAFQTSDPATGWQPQQAWLSDLPSWFLPQNAYGYAGRLPGGDMLWATRGGGAAWAAAAANLGVINATIRELPDGQSQVYAVWGAELTSTAPSNGLGRVPLIWLLVRAWLWVTFARLNLIAPWWWAVLAGLVALGFILWLMNRARFSHHYKVPLGTVIFNPRMIASKAQPEALERAWPRWERTIQNSLYSHGNVQAADLFGIPAPFRQYAIEHYAEAHSSEHGMTMRGSRLHTAARTYIRQWMDAWRATRADLLRDGAHWQNRKQVGKLANALAAMLGLQTLPPIENDSVSAYATKALPEEAASAPNVALLFVADNEALARTAHNIVAALDSLNMPGARGLVISLGRPGRNVDVTNQVRNAIAELEETQRTRLKVLSNEDVMRIMATDDPAQAVKEAL
jgi:photosystem II stability/assembly factor-like uncharacterized protein